MYNAVSCLLIFWCCSWETLDSFMQHDVQELCRVVSSLKCILCLAFCKQKLCNRQMFRNFTDYSSDGNRNL